MEYGTLEKEIYIAASPAVVYEVVSSPEHIKQWWSADADFEMKPGGSGVLVFGDGACTPGTVVQLTVVEAVPGVRFVFRWDHPEGESPRPGNSMLVTFSLIPDGDGTRLKVVEEGFRERGWEAAVLEECYNSHDDGWSRHLADLVTYVEEVVAS